MAEVTHTIVGNGQFPDNNNHKAMKMRDHEECTEKWQKRWKGRGREEGQKGKKGRKKQREEKEYERRGESHLKKVRFTNINYQESLCLQTIESI